MRTVAKESSKRRELDKALFFSYSVQNNVLRKQQRDDARGKESVCYYFNCTINRQSHAFSYNFVAHVTFKIALGYASCNYTTVTSTIIPKLYSNAGDYLY